MRSGLQWQSRILKLQSQMLELTESSPLAPPAGGPYGECSLAASEAFEEALRMERSMPRDGVRRFGRQTVWCTVALLRTVLREAQWHPGDRTLNAAQAEARLASLAIAAIGGSAVDSA